MKKRFICLALLFLTVMGVAQAQPSPSDAKAYYIRGNARYKKGDFDGAIADLTQALTIDPRLALAFNNRGFARYRKGDLDGAIADFTQAIKIDPKDADAYYNRGVVRDKKGDLDGAIADYTQAININPNHAAAKKIGDAIWRRLLAQTDKADAKRAREGQLARESQQRRMQTETTKFRLGLKAEAETNCGPVIEIKGGLVKIYFPVANYGNEHWVQKRRLFPPRYGCRFVNGRYQPPYDF